MSPSTSSIGVGVLALIAGAGVASVASVPVEFVVGAAVVVVAFGLVKQRLHIALLVLLVVLGPVQRVLSVLLGSSEILSVDDVFLGVLTTAVLGLCWQRRRSLIPILLLTGVMLAVAALRAANLSIGLYQARQISIVVIGITVGILLSGAEIRYLARVLLALLVGQILFVGVEFWKGPVVSPLAAVGLTQFQGTEVRLGLPASYLFYYGSSADEYVIRIGGTLLNPPALGVWVAGAVGLLSVLRGKRILIAQLAGAAIVVASFARAGILVIACTVLFPILSRRLKSTAASCFAMLSLAAIAGLFVADQGSSSRHSDGLTEGFQFALKTPWGAGFGHVGNSVKYVQEAAGESLLGIAASGVGLIILIPLAMVLYRLLKIPFMNVAPKHGFAIGSLLATAFSESIGGLDASLPLWILVGFAFQTTSRERESGIHFVGRESRSIESARA